MSLFRLFAGRNSCELLPEPAGPVAVRYTRFKQLLAANDDALGILATLEETYYSGTVFTPDSARRALRRMAGQAALMARALEAMAPGAHPGIEDAAWRALARALDVFDPSPTDQPGLLHAQNFTVPLGHPLAQDTTCSGGKAANLAKARFTFGLPTPDGFVLTVPAFRSFVDENGLTPFIQAELEPFSPLDITDLASRCKRIRQRIKAVELPEAVSEALRQAVAALELRAGPCPKLAVRSSAVGEDGSGASFAGQYETLLDVPREDITQAVKGVYAGKYTPRAVLSRLRLGLDDNDAPMAVLVLPMVPAVASGVLYTQEPTGSTMRVDAVAGRGDTLVSGNALAASVSLPREATAVSENLDDLVPADALRELVRLGLALERCFGAPQDAEWCLEADGRVVLVQTRPLSMPQLSGQGEAPPKLDETRVLLRGGVTASPGAAVGEIFLVDREDSPPPPGAILAARAASPELASLLDSAGGVVTGLGGAASHLATVAREMGLPALFGLPGCPDSLHTGQLVTLDATGARLFAGAMDDLSAGRTRTRSSMAGSPLHRRLRAALDHAAPLTLTDPAAPNFTPRHCITLHDVARYCHEMAMRTMFDQSEAAHGASGALRIKTGLPLSLACIDLGGGLRPGLTTCDTPTPDDFSSAPLRALWQGMTHPGISWEGVLAFAPGSFLAKLAAPATSEAGLDTPGGDSYALAGENYVNFSARFGFHFANIDAICTPGGTGSHIVLHFGGGAGTYTGRCLRAGFLATVLTRLGFTVKLTGDVLDASFKGAPAADTLAALDQLGRLLAVSRLLDMVIVGQADIERMADKFFSEEYDLLTKNQTPPLSGFHLPEEGWSLRTEHGRAVARHDGSRWVSGLSRGLAGVMDRLSGRRYRAFLDSIQAYFRFPLAVAKNSLMGGGKASVYVRPVGGGIDQSGGLAFGIRSLGSYMVFRIDTLKRTAALYSFELGERTEVASREMALTTGQWRELTVDIRGACVDCLLDGEILFSHCDTSPIEGRIGLWTKADSVTDFAGLETRAPGRRAFLP